MAAGRCYQWSMADSRSAERRGGSPFSVGTPRVLVVEDSETIREMVSEALADAGYLTDTRPDGEALEEVWTDSGRIWWCSTSCCPDVTGLH